MSEITPTQTIGPFPHEGWRWAVEASRGAPARALVIEGAMFDGEGRPIDDGWVEAWTPQAEGAESERPIPGFRRVPTGDGGAFRLELSALPAPAGEPFAWITVFGRGMLKHQFSAVFLADDAGHADSPLLAQVPPGRRATLLAQRSGGAQPVYRWDIRVQGAGETVFFDFE